MSFLPIITIFYQKTNVAITLIEYLLWKSGRNKYLFVYFRIRRSKKIYKVVFTHHNDIFSKNGDRDYPYGKILSEIRSKQVLICLFHNTPIYVTSVLPIITIFFLKKTSGLHLNIFFRSTCRKTSSSKNLGFAFMVKYHRLLRHYITLHSSSKTLIAEFPDAILPFNYPDFSKLREISQHSSFVRKLDRSNYHLAENFVDFYEF